MLADCPGARAVHGAVSDVRFGTLFGGSQSEHSAGHVPGSVIATDSAVASVPAFSGVGRIRLSVVVGAFAFAHQCFRATPLTDGARAAAPPR